MDVLQRSLPHNVWNQLGEPDISVRFADGELAAHRTVLESEGCLFTTLLRGRNDLPIPDMTGDVVLQLLLYLYTHSAPPQLRRVAPELLALADRFDIRGLKSVCEMQLVEDLCVDNTVPYYVLGVRHSSELLMTEAARYFARRPLEVLGSQGWAQELRRDSGPLVELSRTVAGYMAVEASVEDLNTLLATGIQLNEEKQSV